MKKTLLIVAITMVTLISTACVNKFAVQELNNKAQEMIASGNIEGAISRLESSIDLDDTLYETHYNLAVAYIQAKKYDKAEVALNKVLEINPDFADAYYSIAVANEEKAYQIISGETEEQVNEDAQNSSDEEKRVLTNEQKQNICKYFAIAVDNYNKYLAKKVNAEDADKVNEKIDFLNKETRSYLLDEQQSESEN